ncbi:sensor histidine kinase [Shinella sp. HZN7]|uniref:sensor histidine kinase n=1 Tax=Shinella sp. (strain HZN7) TaxID=879274 RepID=UPI0007DA6088|nr:PAS domain-containing protein [Shinella sp. HZN7]ANH08602.1 histidine kinase [Shinella sp. HZN7]
MVLEDLYRLLRAGHVQAQGIVDTLTQPLVVLDQGFCVTSVNNAFIDAFKVERDDILGQSLFSLGNGQWDIADLRKLIAEVIPKTAAVVGYEVTHDFPTIGERTFLIDARRLVHPDNNSTSILVVFEDVTESNRERTESDIILAETRHRMKNLFSVIRALAMQTQTEGYTAQEYRETFLGRIDVALRAQEIAPGETSADFAALLDVAVTATDGKRVNIEAGPSTTLPSSKVLPVSMMFHELTTNALKYGALSVPDGRVWLSWRIEEGDDDQTMLVCEWREEDGPTVRPPVHRGYGTELITATAKHLGGSAEQRFDARGLIAIVKLPL